MPDGPIRVEFKMDRDPRLLTVVGTAAQFQAAHVGLDVTGSAQFAHAAENVCREALRQTSDDDGGLEVLLLAFSDRIEISIHHHGELVPAAGLDTFTVAGALEGRPGALKGFELLDCVDRVCFDTQDGVARTTLVKLAPPKS